MINIGLFVLVCGSSFEATADKYALLIGVSDYDYAAVKGGVISLQYPRYDVEALELSLKDKGYKVTPLIDSDARRERILTAFMKLRDEVKEDDLFLLFFAGHGLRDSVIGKTYWLTYDTKLDLLDDNGIRLSHLMDYVGDIKAKQKLILLDHCFSGDVMFDETGSNGSRGPGGAGPRIERGLVPVRDIDSLVKGSGEGTIVLAAARNEAYEHEEFENGLLTEAILGAIESRDADSGEKDGKLSVYEFTSYVRTKVKDLSQRIGVTQEPILEVNAKNVDKWILLDLPEVGPKPQELKAIYMQRIAIWATRDPAWIEEKVKFRERDVMKRWVISVNEDRKLSIDDERAIRSLRTNMEALEQEIASEETVAEFINDELKIIYGIQ